MPRYSQSSTKVNRMVTRMSVKRISECAPPPMAIISRFCYFPHPPPPGLEEHTHYKPLSCIGQRVGRATYIFLIWTISRALPGAERLCRSNHVSVNKYPQKVEQQRRSNNSADRFAMCMRYIRPTSYETAIFGGWGRGKNFKRAREITFKCGQDTPSGFIV